jgi:hypothetical protein
MKVASITDAVIIHGFAAGFHSMGAAPVFCNVLPGALIRHTADQPDSLFE